MAPFYDGTNRDRDEKTPRRSTQHARVNHLDSITDNPANSANPVNPANPGRPVHPNTVQDYRDEAEGHYNRRTEERLDRIFDAVFEMQAALSRSEGAIEARGAQPAEDPAVDDSAAEIRRLTEELERRDRAIEELTHNYSKLSLGIEEARKDTIAALLAPAAGNLIGLLHHSEDAMKQDLSALDAPALARQIDSENNYYFQQMQDTLEALGFEEVEVKVGDPVEGKQHKTLSTVPTEDESLHNTVKEVVMRGFRHPGARSSKPTFPAHVIAYRFQPGSEQSSTQGPKQGSVQGLQPGTA